MTVTGAVGSGSAGGAAASAALAGGGEGAGGIAAMGRAPPPPPPPPPPHPPNKAHTKKNAHAFGMRFAHLTFIFLSLTLSMHNESAPFA